jgi:RHS repeat-associated protein
VHGPGIDEPLLVEDGGQAFAVHADALGSVTGLSDGSQTLAETSTYTSFGELARSGGVAGNGYAYTGREWEPELGLYYYRARYYDPEAGRFLSRDPAGFAAGDENLYAYVFGDPLNWVDPSGNTAAAAVIPWVPSLPLTPAAYVAGCFIGGYLIGTLIDEKLIQPVFWSSPDIGPSGKPKIHQVDHATRKQAKDAARNAGKAAPTNHPSPTRGKPHFHPVDKAGQKIPGVHHNYPR